MGFCEILWAFLCPPCSVLCSRGCGCDFLINVILTALFFVPGMIHACCVATGKDQNVKQEVNVFVGGQGQSNPV